MLYLLDLITLKLWYKIVSAKISGISTAKSIAKNWLILVKFMLVIGLEKAFFK